MPFFLPNIQESCHFNRSPFPPGGTIPSFNLLVILGSTASGKTRAAVQVARTLRGEIISADSRQVYRGMDIGTGKDLAEYGDVPYHLIDIVDPAHEFSMFEFRKRFIEAFLRIQARGRLPLLVGGPAYTSR